MMINYVIDETKIQNQSKYEHHTEIKHKVRSSAFKHLQSLQLSHSKVKDIKYHSLKMQHYMCTANMNKDDIALLFALRTRTVRGIQSDFGVMFKSDQCPLCREDSHKDSIPALLTCKSLQHVDRNASTYEDLFSPSPDIHVRAMHQFRDLLSAREQLMVDRDELSP